MVDFEDPAVVKQDIQVVKDLWHTISGIYIWEFASTLNYEWNIIRGRRPYRWTIWLYSFTRITCLGAVILLFVGLDVSTPYKCRAWVISGLSLGYVSIAASSLLIILRMAGTSYKRDFVLGLVRIRASWVTDQESCIAYNIETNKLNIITTPITDVVLLFIAFVGLFRLRLQDGCTFGIGRHLWTQGVIWFVLATVAGVPPAVFIILDLNCIVLFL
ncbi:hypothetical protein BJV74DRAFT_954232 [Russula compacta]|nr:hypothetical protein BJV74DRAFT_954232 [Russula compacta]